MITSKEVIEKQELIKTLSESTPENDFDVIFNSARLSLNREILKADMECRSKTIGR